MTPEEFARKMRETFSASAHPRSDGRLDTEAAHAAADRLIIELLRELGYGEGAAVFDSEEKWYA